MTLLLDTNVVSAVMQRDADALTRLHAERPGAVILCSPVAAEIRYGLERLPEGRRRRLLEQEYERLHDLLAWADWTNAAAEEFGRQKARLERAGSLIEDMDIAIGAIAKSLGARLATRNMRHMGRLDGVEVEAWG